MASELNWKNIDPDTLPENVQRAYKAMKEQYRVYAAAKAEFEDSMQSLVANTMPDGCELKFGYNFGKLSCAIGPRTERKPKAKKTAADLAALFGS